MEIPLRITFHGLDHSDAIEARIREKVAKLERFHPHIIGCHVRIEGPTKRDYHALTYQVRIDLLVPGAEIVVSREPGRNEGHTDPYVAIRDSFAAAARRLEDHIRRVRGDIKQHEPPPYARVVRLERDDGYGFLETPDGLQIYFHENAVLGGAWSELEVGSEVRFAAADDESDKGPQATTVAPVGKRHPAAGPPRLTGVTRP